jgi:hypothetical protein
MSTRITHRLRRLGRVATGCLLGGALMVPMGRSLAVPMGPTTASQAVNQINSTSMRPMTAAPSVSATPSAVGVDDTMQWVPDRTVPVPGVGYMVIPGHWERRLDAHKVFVPALTGHNPQTGAMSTFPAGTYPPVDERLAP